jgi:hypothetical protein
LSDGEDLNSKATGVERLFEQGDGRSIVETAADGQGFDDLVEPGYIPVECGAFLAICVEEMVRECHVRGDGALGLRFETIIEPVDLPKIGRRFFDQPINAICFHVEGAQVADQPRGTAAADIEERRLDRPGSQTK